jgi:hypothetical protein
MFLTIINLKLKRLRTYRSFAFLFSMHESAKVYFWLLLPCFLLCGCLASFCVAASCLLS